MQLFSSMQSPDFLSYVGSHFFRRQFMGHLAEGRGILCPAAGGAGGHAHRHASSPFTRATMTVHRVELQRPLQSSTGHFSGSPPLLLVHEPENRDTRGHGPSLFTLRLGSPEKYRNIAVHDRRPCPFFARASSLLASLVPIPADSPLLRPDCTKTNTAVKQYGWQARFVS